MLMRFSASREGPLRLTIRLYRNGLDHATSGRDPDSIPTRERIPWQNDLLSEKSSS
jgi:hypothetical protein